LEIWLIGLGPWIVSIDPKVVNPAFSPAVNFLFTDPATKHFGLSLGSYSKREGIVKEKGIRFVYLKTQKIFSCLLNSFTLIYYLLISIEL
jgi:hypothetical protein